MRHSCRYLLEDDRRSFSTVVAIALGERAAMIIQEIHHWVSEHFRAKDKRYLYDGAYWIWNSYKQWKKTFPFIPEPSLKKIILGLESQGILVSGEFNKNRGDRTKWYRINYDLLEQTLLPAEAEYNRICEEALDRKQPPSDLVQPPSDLLQPPSDLGDPLCTTDLSTDLSTDQAENTRADDFFVNSSSIQIQESPSHAQTKNPNIQDPQTPKPLSPVAPENIGKAIAISKQADSYRSFEAKFASPVKVNKKAPLGLQEEGYGDWHLGGNRNNWKPILVKAAIVHLRDDCPTMTPSEENAVRYINNLCGKRDWANFELLAGKALKLEAAQAIAAQNTPPPTETPQQQSAPQIDPIARQRMIEEARRRVAQQAA